MFVRVRVRTCVCMYMRVYEGTVFFSCVSVYACAYMPATVCVSMRAYVGVYMFVCV